MKTVGSKMKNPITYAMYKGEELLCMGTKVEICEKMGIKSSSFDYYRTNMYKKRRHPERGNARLIIRLDGRDVVWGDDKCE